MGCETTSFVPRSEINGLISQAEEGLDREEFQGSTIKGALSKTLNRSGPCGIRTYGPLNPSIGRLNPDPSF